MAPVETVLATVEPEIVQVKPEEKTATKPGLPVTRSARARARSMTNTPAPERNEKAPKRMNMKTKLAEIRPIIPNISSSRKIERKTMVSADSELANLKMPLMSSPQTPT